MRSIRSPAGTLASIGQVPVTGGGYPPNPRSPSLTWQTITYSNYRVWHGCDSHHKSLCWLWRSRQPPGPSRARGEARGLGQAPWLGWPGFGGLAAARPGGQLADQLLHPGAVTLLEHVMEVIPDLLDVDVVPDEALGQGGEQVIRAGQGLPVRAVLRDGPHHVHAVGDHGQMAGLVPGVEHAPGAVVPDHAPVAQVHDRLAKMQHVAGHAPLVGPAQRRRDARGVRAVDRHVHVPLGAVDRLHGALLDPGPGRNRAQHPVPVLAGAARWAGKLVLRPGEPGPEGVPQVGEQPIRRYGGG